MNTADMLYLCRNCLFSFKLIVVSDPVLIQILRAMYQPGSICVVHNIIMGEFSEVWHFIEEQL